QELFGEVERLSQVRAFIVRVGRRIDLARLRANDVRKRQCQYNSACCPTTKWRSRHGVSLVFAVGRFLSPFAEVSVVLSPPPHGRPSSQEDIVTEVGRPKRSDVQLFKPLQTQREILELLTDKRRKCQRGLDGGSSIEASAVG